MNPARSRIPRLHRGPHATLRGYALLLSFLLVAACTPPATPDRTATPAGLISKDEAIAAAIQLTSSSRPEMSGPLVTPQPVQARQLTLAEAQALLLGEPSIVSGYDPDAAVWLVELEGLWASEATAPGITPPPTPPILRRAAVILDAATGLEIETSFNP